MSEIQINDFNDLHIKHHFEERKMDFFPLWHYTSVDGLMGIIRNNKTEHGKMHFWFTRSDCLNDTSEGEHILNLFKELCSTLLKEKEINQSFYECIKDATIPNSQFINFPVPADDDITHASFIDCPPCHAYICSFSLKEDSLDMWRYYSKGNGGYGLKCYPFLFDKLKDYEFSDYDEKATFSMIRSYKVIYNNSEKEKILKEIIKDTFTAYQKSNKTESEKITAAKGFIQYALKIFQFQFKHECYASEQEYRFVFYRPYSKPKELKNELPEIKYRSQNGIVVPYIDIVVEDGKTFLEEVLISPYIENQNVVATTCDYLSQCGYNCTTRKSLLPVRM